VATLTAAGAAALPHARATLAAAAAVRRTVDVVTGLLTGRIVVGMVTGCTVSLALGHSVLILLAVCAPSDGDAVVGLIPMH
jgi:DNA-binding transcriptional LysR family regulator